MFVYHGAWAYGAVCLWAESSVLPESAPPRAGRPSRVPRQHPFAVLPEIGVDGVEDEVTLRLPTVGDAPFPSPELGREPPPGRASLASWRVPALVFEAADVTRALDALDPPAGATITYLETAARFAGDLVARGRVLPVLAAEDDGYAARWRPVLAAADARRARELAAAMPPLLRAADDPQPGPLLAEILDAFADGQARTRLPGSLLASRRGRSPKRIPYPERLVASLTSQAPLIVSETAEDETEAASLAADLAEWSAAARLPAGPVRTSFRLVEPDETVDPDAWTVELALQSAEDPSLMLPAADVWAGAGGGWLSPDVYPEEALLSGLGAAARLFPELNEALRDAAPARVALDTPGALGFLRETGPLLSGAGFGVLLPDWARKARLGLKLTTTSSSSNPASSNRESLFRMNDLVDFRYDLAIGDQVLSPGELAELAAMKVPLVRVRGQWVELDDRHLKAALKFLEGKRSGTMTAGEALLAGTRGEDAEEIPLTSVEADGWLGDLLSGETERRLEPRPAPDGFSGELRPYQERGLAWLDFLGSLGLGGILADDMGLGKTVQMLALLRSTAVPARGDDPPEPPDARPVASDLTGRAIPFGKTLLICPMSLVGNWQREAAKFTPGLRVHVHHGADRRSGDEFADAVDNCDLVVTTYQTATRDAATLGTVQWARVVCDEAQAIKNHGTAQAKAVRSLPAVSRIALTGTPVENQLSELWSIMEFVNPGLLGSGASFRERFSIPVERHGNEEAAQRLRRITQPFVLRRLKTDKSIISDLPDKQEIKVWCNLTQEQASLYQATVDDMLARIEAADEEIQRRGLVLATMAKLKQVCNHPAHLLGDGSRLPGRSGKLERLEEICEEITADGDKALLFTQYAEWGRVLQPYLAARTGATVLFLHGGLSKKKRDALVTRFQEADEPVLFLLSLKAGGTGLNLTAASHVMHVDRWWNPAVEEQATDRAFRIGQRRDVQVRKFICVGTLEEKIDEMIASKKALAEQIVGSGEGWLTELSTDELRSVVSLSSEAVGE
ncbi:MAG: SNF2-related protein [Streptosporangiales bacterium]|nr:SNF2-related protein [Streptosporangiales bacterium]